ALLFRKWGKRVKGRDWYDMEWYIKRAVPLHLQHLALRANDSGDWPSTQLSKEEFMELLTAKIDSVDLNRVREDVLPFIKDDQRLAIWSADYFRDLSKLIRFM
ncbi:MAG TPA: hypothetical protein VK616_09150, partial [Flavitalea sp.]|nr:hypothetical protein [Flavitalea sp.]